MTSFPSGYLICGPALDGGTRLMPTCILLLLGDWFATDDVDDVTDVEWEDIEECVCLYIISEQKERVS